MNIDGRSLQLDPEARTRNNRTRAPRISPLEVYCDDCDRDAEQYCYREHEIPAGDSHDGRRFHGARFRRASQTLLKARRPEPTSEPPKDWPMSEPLRRGQRNIAPRAVPDGYRVGEDGFVVTDSQTDLARLPA
jgi:hypothetical protein